MRTQPRFFLPSVIMAVATQFLRFLTQKAAAFMVIIAIGLILLIGAGVWRSGPSGPRLLIAFVGGSVVITGIITALSLPELAGGPQLAADAPTLRIRISGTPGLHYQGAWAVTTLGGSAASANIRGTTPHLYTMSQQGDLDVRIHRLSPSGHLILEILVNGQVVAKRESSGHSTTVFASYETNGVSG